MGKRVVSIEIGNSITKICEMDYKAKKPKVYKYVSVKTPDDVLMDGMLQTSDALEEAIVRGIASKGIKTRDVIFSISSTKIATREVAIPFVKEAKIESVIKANAQDYFPIDLEQYEVGYHLVGKPEADKANRMKVMVLAAPKNLLAGYYALAEGCGLNVIGFDYASNSVYQVMKDECGEEITMVLKIDETSTIVTVMNAGQIVLQRNLAYGVGDAVDTLITTKAYQAKDYSEALEVLRRNVCINPALASMEKEEGEAQDTAEDEQIVKAKKSITAALGGLITAISRAVDYYNSKNGDLPITKVFLTGLGGDFGGLDKLLSNSLENNVTVLSQINGVVLGKSMKEEGFGEYIACIGAVINPVGFVDEEEKNKGNITVVSGTNYTFVSAAVLVMGILVAVALSMTALTRHADAKAQNESLNTQITVLSPVQQIYDEYVATKNQSDKYTEYYQFTETTNENLVAVINELEDILPSSFYTNSFTSDDVGISMTVCVEGKKAAARVIRNIRDMESIENVEVSIINETKNELDESLVTFSIMGTYRDIHAEEAQAQ